MYFDKLYPFIMCGAVALTGIAAPAVAQSVPQAYRDRIGSGPYKAKEDSPYSTRTQRRIRTAKTIAREVAKDKKGNFFHFKPVERDDEDEDDDDYYSHDD